MSSMYRIYEFKKHIIVTSHCICTRKVHLCVYAPCRGYGGKLLVILNHNNGWRWVVSFMTSPALPWKDHGTFGIVIKKKKISQPHSRDWIPAICCKVARQIVMTLTISVGPKWEWVMVFVVVEVVKLGIHSIL
jgi:hypothetical protein